MGVWRSLGEVDIAGSLTKSLCHRLLRGWGGQLLRESEPKRGPYIELGLPPQQPERLGTSLREIVVRYGLIA